MKSECVYAGARRLDQHQFVNNVIIGVAVAVSGHWFKHTVCWRIYSIRNFSDHPEVNQSSQWKADTINMFSVKNAQPDASILWLQMVGMVLNYKKGFKKPCSLIASWKTKNNEWETKCFKDYSLFSFAFFHTYWVDFRRTHLVSHSLCVCLQNPTAIQTNETEHEN